MAFSVVILALAAAPSRPDNPPLLAVAGTARDRARRGGSLMRFLGENEGDDPLLSVVNVIDVFLVVIAMLMIIIVRNPLNPFAAKNAVVVENPGKSEMRITMKEGQELTRYESSGEIGQGKGARADIAFRLPDGRVIYVLEVQAAR
ncbi:DUF2149 domain-containing protein [Boseaceae bacterium BT-24-1]|nr:DUF2149 domain-containing protein [Boseaceae bacterium BT-24-1]